ncbi:S-formylglutathione hydrolase [Marinobacter lutaoensis]|jgi:S-formylglutathione hydrolase|uniref:S-formylglutathione hydrolase n=1 Tax=Marinobacter lutaoensis TaxID=135739 RepID=A0A1V2DUC6_9GAMM|nr:S-formylglutathione hydrolase [Marinobacter lutaoensis]MBE01494.1 S-formylglutathione hydrolase [Marinobacter sp.]MBI43387.1 S-formylglutathione hydrolase [Oceanospirillales bacterium]ONF44335.1 S-formylglutathione hydrolase [Marinobacter lutaoensis]|tara:strand:- start:636 stop:1481 length:846 start_codon:yes stop_codon:yes gene_type:complete
MELLSTNLCFGGEHRRYRHASHALACDMEFAVFLPPAALGPEPAPVPVLYWLSGLTCTDQNFMQKAGAQRLAAQLGLAIVCPDTSPRGVNLPGEDDSYDFGSGAGFYLNATRQPWARHYRMYDYVVTELPALVEARLPVTDQRAISGHSMGGHGALVCALRNPGRYRSVSAFAPIAHPSQCPWGEKAFSGYLGDDRERWAAWDATLLIPQARERLPLLVDQGTADEFLDTQLNPEALVDACERHHHPIQLRMHRGYDHSYFFIASFIDDHLLHHAQALGLR